jgi:hypothetical protein
MEPTIGNDDSPQNNFLMNGKTIGQKSSNILRNERHPNHRRQPTSLWGKGAVPEESRELWNINVAGKKTGTALF